MESSKRIQEKAHPWSGGARLTIAKNQLFPALGLSRPFQVSMLFSGCIGNPLRISAIRKKIPCVAIACNEEPYHIQECSTAKIWCGSRLLEL